VFSRGNLAIRDHADNGEDLLFFRKVRDGYLRYVGQYDYAGHEIRDGVRDRDGGLRTAIAFRLIPHDLLVRETAEDDGSVGDTDKDDLERLRAVALITPDAYDSPIEARRKIWRRSRAVRRYVLLRAGGHCEGCFSPAPFARPDGSPYLEPHHTRRISDGGADNPRWVIALCPTCHRRVHHGADGPSYNALLETKLQTIEPV
jgi:5-methylcytosine-specific restriction protein A